MIDDATHILLSWLREDFGVEVATIEPVGHGADQFARLWRARDVDGGRYAVKLSGGGTPAGLVVTAHLAGQGVPGIVAPHRTRDGRPWSLREGRRLSLVPWVSDDRALDGTMTPAHWHAYGKVLAAVHAAQVTDEVAALLPVGGADHPTVVAAAREMAGRLSGATFDDLTDPVVCELGRIWSQVADPVSTLTRAVERFGDELRGRPATAVLCHGDPHLGNLMLGPRGQVWLIDWDDAVLAPRECDLMFVTGGVLAFAPVTARQREAFFAGYGPVDLDRERLAWFLAVRALFDFADWSAQALDPELDDAERARALRIVRGLVSPVGLVVLADGALRDLRPGP